MLNLADRAVPAASGVEFDRSLEDFDTVGLSDQSQLYIFPPNGVDGPHPVPHLGNNGFYRQDISYVVVTPKRLYVKCNDVMTIKMLNTSL